LGRQIAGQLHELVVAGHRRAFAAEVDHCPHATGKIGEYGDATGSGGAAGPLLHRLFPSFRNSSMAFSRSPPHCVRARLQSIMGKPVRSRRS